MEVDRERALDMTRKGFSTMTELADELVRSQGLSFAAAKKLVAGWCFWPMRSISL